MGSRVDIFFPNKGEFIHTIIDRGNIRIGGAGTAGGGEATLLINTASFDVITGTYDLGIVNADGAPVGTPDPSQNKVTIASSSLALKDTLGATKETVVQVAEEVGEFELGDLEVQVVDEADEVILTTTRRAYSDTVLELTALPQGTVVVGENARIWTGAEAPIDPENYDYWFKPI